MRSRRNEIRLAPARALIWLGVPSASSRPLVDDDDPVRGLVGFLQVMRGEQQRPALGDLGLHVGPERLAGLDVHRRGGLVEHDQVAFAHDGQREPDPLGLAAGQLVHPLVGEPAMPARFSVWSTGSGRG